MIKHILTIPLFLITVLCLPFMLSINGIFRELAMYWECVKEPSRAYKTFYKKLWF